MTTFTATGIAATATISVDSSRILFEIKDEIYSAFTEHMGRCIYDPGNPLSDENGFRKDVTEAVRELNVPVITISSTSTLDEALAWVEYCNGTNDTYYANLRRKNGRERPYSLAVRYRSNSALGNEIGGPWQIGHLTKEDYAKKAFQWAKALKLLDLNIILILCGETGYRDWGRCYTDMHSIHIYTADKNHLSNMTASLIDMARMQKSVTKRLAICFDEWNVWDLVRAPGELGGEKLYTLSDALAVGTWLNPLYLASNYMRGRTIGSHVTCKAYKGNTNPTWLASTVDIPCLDVAVALDKEGWINVSVVNIKSDTGIKAKIKGVEKAKGEVQVGREG
ncbi:glycoside hydrolase superfamily [Kalaharituber pfeilii]|nr:glycoside hydrolase superfamily [Kalaharituber pfeilii]